MIRAGSTVGIIAGTIKEVDCVQNYTVAAEDYGKAAGFTREYGFGRACGSYEELMEDAGTEPVYIATSYSYHYEHIKLCLDHGKHMLCEKSFTVNKSQAREVLELAREKKLLLTEAIWARYISVRETPDDVLLSGVIGRSHILAANLGYIISGKRRIMYPELAGGTLLDVGIYPLSSASMVFRDEADTITNIAVMTKASMSAQNSVTTAYRDGRMAVLCNGAVGLSGRRGIIYGDNGFIEVESVNNCEGIRIYDRPRSMITSYDTPKQISRYEYEVETCLQTIEEGALGCPEMPCEETLRMMGWMDELRR